MPKLPTLPDSPEKIVGAPAKAKRLGLVAADMADIAPKKLRRPIENRPTTRQLRRKR